MSLGRGGDVFYMTPGEGLSPRFLCSELERGRRRETGEVVESIVIRPVRVVLVSALVALYSFYLGLMCVLRVSK